MGRFNSPTTPSLRKPEDPKQFIKQDPVTGATVFDNGTERWQVTKHGHRSVLEGVETVMEEGALQRTNGSRQVAQVAVYHEQEWPVTLKQENGLEVLEHLRVAIGVFDERLEGGQLILLSNNKFYIVNSLTEPVLYSQEVNIAQLHQALTATKQLQQSIGSMGSLRVKHKDLVSAINDLSERMTCPRRLVGWLKYYATDEESLNLVRAYDLDPAFRQDNQQFYYWSEPQGEWVTLPDGWAKIPYVRTQAELGNQFLDGEIVGVLDTSTVWLFTNDHWEQVFELDWPMHENGDEYAVQAVVDNKTFKRQGTSIVCIRRKFYPAWPIEDYYSF